MRAVVVVALVAAVAAGCGGAEQPPRAARTEAPPLPRAQTVRFKATDGRTVGAKYTPAAKPGAPAVVLLHEIRGGVDQWDDLVPYLHAAGFATLSYESRASVNERDRARDTFGALRWLRGRPDVDRRRLALVGASIGASTTVYAMAAGARRTVDAAVALSPPDSADIWALQDHGRYHPRDMLLVSDKRESAAVDGMMDGAEQSRAMVSRRPGHGVALLADTRVRDALISWLQQHAD